MLGLLTLSLGAAAQTSTSDEWQVKTLVKSGAAVTEADNLNDAIIYTTGVKTPTLSLVSKDGDYKELYVTSQDNIIGKVDLNAGTFKKVIEDKTIKGNNGACFSLDGDTLIYTIDNGQWWSTGKLCSKYTLRSENFQNVYDYANGVGAYGPAYNPMDKSVYYSSWGNTGLFKVVYNAANGHHEGKRLFNARTKDGNTRIAIHPTGKYIYIFSRGYMYRSTYNEGTNTYNTPTLFAGKDNETGYKDGNGLDARFCFEKAYGVFVKNPLYDKSDDEYDFYVTDTENHCIRKVTPSGEVSLFAGTPKAKGGEDGNVLTASFNMPTGIAYDEETQTFYVADCNGIRTITNGNATGISTLDYKPQTAERSVIYNLAGQRVGKNYKGIVIENGKKIIKK